MEELDFGVLNSSHIVVWDWNVQRGEMTDFDDKVRFWLPKGKCIHSSDQFTSCKKKNANMNDLLLEECSVFILLCFLLRSLL